MVDIPNATGTDNTTYSFKIRVTGRWGFYYAMFLAVPFGFYLLVAGMLGDGGEGEGERDWRWGNRGGDVFFFFFCLIIFFFSQPSLTLSNSKNTTPL